VSRVGKKSKGGEVIGFPLRPEEKKGGRKGQRIKYKRTKTGKSQYGNHKRLR